MRCLLSKASGVVPAAASELHAALFNQRPPDTQTPLQVWYGVPAAASQALEEAMADALPHLTERSPNLLYQLVTMLSPAELRVRLSDIVTRGGACTRVCLVAWIACML